MQIFTPLVLDQDNKFPCLLNLHLSIWCGLPLSSVSSSPPCRRPVFQSMIVESVRTRSHQTLPVLGAGDRQAKTPKAGQGEFRWVGRGRGALLVWICCISSWKFFMELSFQDSAQSLTRGSEVRKSWICSPALSPAFWGISRNIIILGFI